MDRLDILARAVAEYVLGHQKEFTLALLVASVALGLFTAFTLQINADITGLAPQDDQRFLDLIKYTAEKLTSNTLIVVVEGVKQLDHDSIAQELKDLFEGSPHVNRAEAFDNPETLVKYGLLAWGEGTLSDTVRYYESLVKTEPKTLVDFRFWRNTGIALYDLNTYLEELVTKSGIRKYYLLSPDKDMLVMNFSVKKPLSDVRFVSSAVRELKGVSRQFDLKHGTRTLFTGGVMGAYESNEQARKDFTFTSFISIAGVVVVLLIGFGNLFELLIILVGLLMAMAISLGLITLMLRELNIVTTFVNAMLLGLGIDYAMYIVTRIQERFNVDGVSRKSIIEAFVENFRPSFVSMLTTALAFLTMILSPSNAVRQMGISVALGVFVYFTVFNVLVPISHARFIDKFRKRERETYMRLVDILRRSRMLMLLTVTLTLALAGLGVYSIANFSYTASSLIPQNAESVLAQERIAEKFGSVGNSDIVVASADSTELQETLQRLRDEGIISKDFSILTFIQNPEKVAEEKANIYTRMIEITHVPLLELIFKKYGLYESFVSTLDVLKNVTTTQDLFKLMERDIPSLFYTSVDGQQYLLAYVSTDYNLWSPEKFKWFFEKMRDYNVRVYGYSALFYNVIDELLKSTTWVFLFVFLAEFIVLLLDFKKVSSVAGILTLTTLNALAAFGISLLAGIRANFITFIVLPIFLGIGVDSLVELRHSVKYGRESVLKTEKAIVMCVLTTVASFGSFVFARGQLLRDFGFVTSAGLLGTLFIAFFWYLNVIDRRGGLDIIRPNVSKTLRARGLLSRRPDAEPTCNEPDGEQLGGN